MVSSANLTFQNCHFLVRATVSGVNFTIDNSRFQDSGNYDGAIQIKSGGWASISNSFFIDNVPHIKIVGNAYLSLNSNSFSRSFYYGIGTNTSSFDCTNATSLTFTSFSGNSFCGFGTGVINQCGLNVDLSNLTPKDSCGVCGGMNQKKDCNGICFGTTTGSACHQQQGKKKEKKKKSKKDNCFFFFFWLKLFSAFSVLCE